MSLLDRSLKLSLFVASAMTFTACDGGAKCDTATGEGCDTTGTTETDADADADSDTDTDTDTDTDSDVTTYETGIALLWYAGDAVATSGSFTSGHFGTDITDVANLPNFDPSMSVCYNVGEWTQTGDATPGCPDCAWSFELTVGGTVAEGAYCDQFGRYGGEWDDFAGSWGASDYYLYTYGSYSFPLELVLWYYFNGYGWGFLAYNYGGYGYNAGSAEDLEFHRYYAAYYFYP